MRRRSDLIASLACFAAAAALLWRIETFKQELAALQDKYQVRLVPVIKTYNGGQQIADVEIVANAPAA